MAIVAPLTANDLAISDAFERELMLDSAREQDAAGGTLTVRRVPEAANERTERPESAIVGTVSGYVYRSQRQQIIAGAADFTPVDTWQLVAEGTPDVRENDELVSVATPALAWQVMGVEVHTGYVMATLEAL